MSLSFFPPIREPFIQFWMFLMTWPDPRLQYSIEWQLYPTLGRQSGLEELKLINVLSSLVSILWLSCQLESHFKIQSERDTYCQNLKLILLSSRSFIHYTHSWLGHCEKNYIMATKRKKRERRKGDNGYFREWKFEEAMHSLAFILSYSSQLWGTLRNRVLQGSQRGKVNHF